MKESDREGVATRSGPESCAVAREGGGEALTGVRAGQPLSREERLLRSADVVSQGGRQNQVCREREAHLDSARSETLRMHGNTSHGNREIPRSSAAEGTADRNGKSKDSRRR